MALLACSVSATRRALVDALDLAQRIADEVRVLNVDEARLRAGVAHLDRAVDHAANLARPVAAHLARVDLVREDPAPVRDHRAERGHRRLRIAVRLHDDRVGKHREQLAQILHVVRGLEHPPLCGPLPLKRLQRAAQEAIRRVERLRLEPARVGRNVQSRLRRLTGKRHVEQEHVLFGRVGFDRVNREELWRERAQSALGELRVAATLVRAALALARQRHRRERLPRVQRPRARVRSEQAVEHRRPGALKACDHDGLAQRERVELGVRLGEGLDAQAVLEQRDEPAAHDRATERVQPRLAVDRREQAIERLAKGVLAEVLKASALLRRAQKLRGDQRLQGQRPADTVERARDQGTMRVRVVGGGLQR
jgi:hypothetical protein